MKASQSLYIPVLVAFTASGCVKTVEMRTSSALTLQNIESHVDPQSQGIAYYETMPSHGRFPAGIAVARVMQQEGEFKEDKYLRLSPLESYQATYWAELFDGTPEIREMVMVHSRSVRQELVSKEELLAAAKVLKTKLLLIYGYDNTSNYDQCTVSGVIYDVATGDVVASVTHTVTLDEATAQALTLPEIKQPKNDTDNHFYMDFLAFRGFEEKVRNCSWHLIDADEASTELLPNPFENPKPAYPRAWRRR